MKINNKNEKKLLKGDFGKLIELYQPLILKQIYTYVKKGFLTKENIDDVKQYVNERLLKKKKLYISNITDSPLYKAIL